jgi:hypothetical protein
MLSADSLFDHRASFDINLSTATGRLEISHLLTKWAKTDPECYTAAIKKLAGTVAADEDARDDTARPADDEISILDLVIEHFKPLDPLQDASFKIESLRFMGNCCIDNGV